MKTVASLIISVSVCVGADKPGVQLDLVESEPLDFQLDAVPEKPVLPWDRYTRAVTDRSERAFGRLKPIYSMRLMVFDEENGADRIQDTAISTLNRLFTHGGNVLLRESQPYLTLKYKTRAWGDFIDNSVRDTIENVGEFFRDDMLARDPAAMPHDLMLDPEGPSPARMSVWDNKVSYGVGAKGGGPSLFVRGRVSHHRRTLAFYDLRANVDGFDEFKIQNSLMFPITQWLKLSTGITWSPLDGDLRYAVRGHVRLAEQWNMVASIGVGHGVTQGFLGSTFSF